MKRNLSKLAITAIADALVNAGTDLLDVMAEHGDHGASAVERFYKGDLIIIVTPDHSWLMPKEWIMQKEDRDDVLGDVVVPADASDLE